MPKHPQKQYNITQPAAAQNIKLLAIYQYIRVLIGLLLLTLQLTSHSDSVLGSQEQQTYIWATAIYIATCVLTIVVWPPTKLRNSHHRLVGSLLFDISTMLVLMHASGGVGSGLGYLLIIFVAIMLFVQCIYAEESQTDSITLFHVKLFHK